MKLLDLAKEVAALAGYNITGTDAQAVANKARAIRRINQVRTDIASRFAGRWQGLYREGWLGLVPVYSTGTVTVTLDSRTVTGSGTAFTSAMVGRKFLGPDSAYYKIASVTSGTVLILTEPYQSATASGASYQIWKDEYVLYPEANSIIDFVNYIEPGQMIEDFNRHSRMLAPRATANETPKTFVIVGRQQTVGEYSTGTVTGTAGSRTLTGTTTAWLGNLYPGYELTIGSTTYHVLKVNSDTSLELYQDITTSITTSAYSARGRNALVVRFLKPSSQTVVSYAYNAKVYPLVDDDDEDWIAELYSHVLLDGVMKYDYLDKNDAVRASQAAQFFENSIRNAHQADASQFGGTIVIGLDIPDSARE
jgi:hypothetical protein